MFKKFSLYTNKFIFFTILKNLTFIKNYFFFSFFRQRGGLEPGTFWLRARYAIRCATETQHFLKKNQEPRGTKMIPRGGDV